jgi:hypothetical protein
MVSGWLIFDAGLKLLLAAQQSNAPVLEQLDKPRRAAVIMALLALTLVGLFLITLVMVGGHWVRRLARHRPGRQKTRAGAIGDHKLQEALQSILPEGKIGDTVLLDRPSRDTTVDT